MSYSGKTDWKLDEMVYPEDMNRIEGQIEKNTSEIDGVSGKIGNPSDGEEQLTLFGKLAAILAKVLGIDTKVGTSDDAKTKPTLFGKIAGIGDTLSENLTPVTEKITELLTKVTGMDGKIGTAADTSADDTLFGKVASMKTNLENSSGVYQYSKTAIKKRIQNWTILPPGEEPDVSFYGKLTTLHAEKDGMVYVKIDSKDKGQTYFGIFHSVGAAIHDMPDQTTISGYNTYTHRMLEAYAAYVDKYNSTGTTARNVVLELAIPVQGGVDYVFMYYGYRQDEAVLNEFILAYEDGTEEA